MKINNKDVKVYDNGGITNDRYTVVIDKSVYAMNKIPFDSAFGFSQYCGEVADGYLYNKSWGKEIHDISELNEDTIQAIIQRFED